MLDMARKPFLSHEKSRHGRMVWYFKRNGKRIRLPDTYGSEEFSAAYEKALSSNPAEETTLPKPKTGTLRWLVGEYMRSTDFAALAPRTRSVRSNILNNIAANNPEVAFGDITQAVVKKTLDGKADTPEQANTILKTLNHMFKWAVSAEHYEASPSAGLKKIKTTTEGFHTWTIDEVEQYRARHKLGTKPRLAIDLLLFLGLRRSDVIKVGKQHVRDGVISIRTGKNGTWVHLPMCKQLRESVEATDTGDLAFLTHSWGEPFASGDSFGNWFKDRVVEAGLPHCTAHGLRKAGATIAADEGATAHELMAMFGWKKLAMAELYTREADKKRLARGASERLSNRM